MKRYDVVCFIWAAFFFSEYFATANDIFRTFNLYTFYATNNIAMLCYDNAQSRENIKIIAFASQRRNKKPPTLFLVVMSWAGAVIWWVRDRWTYGFGAS